MASRFLVGFSQGLVNRLHADGALVVRRGAVDAVGLRLAEKLAASGEHKSLIPQVVKVLLEDPDVDDLFADDDDIARAAESLGPGALR